MFHEPVFSIFMATLAVAVSLLVWNLISNAGPAEADVALVRVAKRSA